MSDWSTMKDPTSVDERRACAAKACAELGLQFTTIVDTFDDRVACRWSGWPERLVVVSKTGHVVYAGEQGPFGFNPGAGYEGFQKRGIGVSLEAFLNAWK